MLFKKAEKEVAQLYKHIIVAGNMAVLLSKVKIIRMYSLINF